GRHDGHGGPRPHPAGGRRGVRQVRAGRAAEEEERNHAGRPGRRDPVLQGAGHPDHDGRDVRRADLRQPGDPEGDRRQREGGPVEGRRRGETGGAGGGEPAAEDGGRGPGRVGEAGGEGEGRGRGAQGGGRGPGPGEGRGGGGRGDQDAGRRPRVRGGEGGGGPVGVRATAATGGRGAAVEAVGREVPDHLDAGGEFRVAVRRAVPAARRADGRQARQGGREEVTRWGSTA